MAIQFASGALKSRDTPQSQWEDAIVAVRVNDVAVQDTTPTGTEHIWVDTDDPGEVVVPTIEDHNVLANAIGIVVDGNKSALGATTGQYVILQNSTITGKDDGLYTAAQTIPANTVIDGTYLTAVSGGGLNALEDKLDALKSSIGTIVDGTNATSLNVATATYTNISTMTLPKGKWIVVAGHQWSTSFTGLCIMRLLQNSALIYGCLIRYDIDSGGGQNVCGIVNASSQVTINLNAYQASGTTKTASNVSLKAIRIA